MRAMRLLPAIALLSGLAIVSPTTADATPHLGGLSCTNVFYSDVCPPDYVGYSGAYQWQRPVTGAEADTLMGSLPSGWFEQSVGTPGGCSSNCVDTWSTGDVAFSNGVLSMATRCTGILEHGIYVSSCTSGGVGQDEGDYATTAGDATAIEARVTGAGTNGTTWWTDNLAQLSQYCSGCAWPPEVDLMENSTGSLSSYNEYLHCWSGPNEQYGDPDNDGETTQTGDTDNDGDMDQVAQQKDEGISFDVGAWATYEIDWTSTQILIYASQGGTAHLEADWLRSTLVNFAGYHDTACNDYWPPTPHAALGLFLQSQLVGSTSPTSGTYGIQVNWIAQQPLA